MMTKTAENLIKSLGLEEYIDTARISFFYRSVPRTFLVVYDSKNKNRIITKQIIMNYGNLGIYRDGEDLLDFSPPIDLVKFNGSTKGIFVTYDISPDMRVDGRSPYSESLNISKMNVFKL